MSKEKYSCLSFSSSSTDYFGWYQITLLMGEHYILWFNLLCILPLG